MERLLAALIAAQFLPDEDRGPLLERMTARGGPLAGLGGLLFLIAPEASKASGECRSCVQVFIGETAPRLVAQLRRRAEPVRVDTSYGPRGRVDWPATLKARGEPGNSARYVCRQNRPDYDQPENQLLLFLLHAVERSMERSGAHAELERGPLHQARLIRELLLDLQARAALLRRGLPGAGQITLPVRITPTHLQAASTSRIAGYAALPPLYYLYHGLLEAPDPAQWSRVLRECLPLPREVRNLLNGVDAMPHEPNRPPTRNAAPEIAPADLFELPAGVTDEELQQEVLALETARNAFQREADQAYFRAVTKKRRTLGPPQRVRPEALSSAGWALVVPKEFPVTPGDRVHWEAAQRLLRHRERQAGRSLPVLCYEAGWSAPAFLAGDGRDIDLGQMDVRTVPYYLCLVGSPEQIPWEVQTGLDGEYAVGRLWFDDPADCTAHVDRLIAYEEAQLEQRLPAGKARLLLLGTEHAGDPNTRLGSEKLVQPLHAWLEKEFPEGPRPRVLRGPGSDAGVDGPAGRATLVEFLQGKTAPRPPTVLMTVGHGCGPGQGGPAGLGALVCQDASDYTKAVVEDHCFWSGSVSRLKPETDLAGTFWFAFACYGAGREQGGARIAPLPQKLLARGLTGFIGHIDPATEYSIMGAVRKRPHTELFGTALWAMLTGTPVGHALDDPNRRTAQYTVQLEGNNQLTAAERRNLWLARNDCRNWVLLGDPAARLPLA